MITASPGEAAGLHISMFRKVSSTFDKYVPFLKEAEITDKFIENIERVFNACGTDAVFGQVNVQEWLKCSKSKSTSIMKAMKTAWDYGRGAQEHWRKYYS